MIKNMVFDNSFTIVGFTNVSPRLIEACVVYTLIKNSLALVL